MGLIEAAMRVDLKKQTEAIERTNTLLTALLAEVKTSNEMARKQLAKVV